MVDNVEVKVVKVLFINVDVVVVVNINKIIDNYLQIKNVFINGKVNEVGDVVKNMFEVLKGLDKLLFIVEQKKVYDQQEVGLKENVEYIFQGIGEIEYQCVYFFLMSEGMYILVKVFGVGKILYYDYCFMVKDGKGVMWLSEIKEIKNFYFGDKMMKCGSVEEEI